MARKSVIQTEPVVEPPTKPCEWCRATGLVSGGYKYQRTCPTCSGTRVVPA